MNWLAANLNNFLAIVLLVLIYIYGRLNTILINCKKTYKNQQIKNITHKTDLINSQIQQQKAQLKHHRQLVNRLQSILHDDQVKYDQQLHNIKKQNDANIKLTNQYKQIQDYQSKLDELLSNI